VQDAPEHLDEGMVVVGLGARTDVLIGEPFDVGFDGLVEMFLTLEGPSCRRNPAPDAFLQLISHMDGHEMKVNCAMAKPLQPPQGMKLANPIDVAIYVWHCDRLGRKDYVGKDQHH
jgi:hypothetical protein